MKLSVILSAALVACASAPPPEPCPKCYSIDEVAPYEPPQRMIILCAEPLDAGVAPDAELDPNRPIY